MSLSFFQSVRNRRFLFLWIAPFIANSITFFMVRRQIGSGTQTVALHYNVLTGVDSIGPGTNLYVLPLVGVMITVINLIIYRAFPERNWFWSFLLGFVSLFVSVALLVASLFLFRVN